jgi:hypothetical protein
VGEPERPSGRVGVQHPHRPVAKPCWLLPLALLTAPVPAPPTPPTAAPEWSAGPPVSSPDSTGLRSVPVPAWPPEGDEADDRAANIANASELGVGVERVVTDNGNGYRSGPSAKCWLGPG